MTIEEVKVKKTEMEQKISSAMKEFEEGTGLEVSYVGFSRCTKSKELGIEEDYNYNTQTHINL
jgi:hypothetical protein